MPNLNPRSIEKIKNRLLLTKEKPDLAVLLELEKIVDGLEEIKNAEFEKIKEMLGLVEDLQKKTQNLSLDLENKNSSITEENKNQLNIFLENLNALIDNFRAEINTGVEKRIKTFLNNFEKVVRRAENIQPGKPGKDANPEDVVSLVLEKIKLPKVKDIVLDDGEKIVQKINDLSIDDETLKIDATHITGLEKLIKTQQVFMGGLNGLGVKESIKDIDLSSQLDGTTKTFNIQAVWNIISVSLSSYPYGALRKGVDYTWTPTSITFTSEIDAATQLSSGQKCILTIVSA